ncbi:MAG: thioredoxin family protein [Candidatus Marinimicrobia bacterium]|nr:thioredoxin family protein [Candidatus Neomarinimicrobiota bacterium]
MKIKIIGRENFLQKQLKKYVEDVIHELGLECTLDVIHHTDEILKIEEKKVMLTPALLVDDKIICQGHVWSKEHIKHFLQQFCADPKGNNENKMPDKFAKWKGIPGKKLIGHPPLIRRNVRVADFV